MASSTDTSDPRLDARRRRTVVWVVGLATFGLIFDGYDLVVYGTVVSTFLRDPSHIGEVSPGAPARGQLCADRRAGGRVDRRYRRRHPRPSEGDAYRLRVVRDRHGLNCVDEHDDDVWIAAVSDWFGCGRAGGHDGRPGPEYAPPGKKNLANAITYSGVPVGSLLAALLAIVLLDLIGWRGMFWIGALPLVTLLPLAFFKMPESVAWLAATGRHDEARGSPSGPGFRFPTRRPAAPKRPARCPHPRAGRGSPAYSAAPTYPDGAAGVDERYRPSAGLLLEHLATELMRRAGFEAKGSLAFLLVLNGGAIVGALIGSRVADRLGPKPVVAACFLIGAVAIALLTFSLPLACSC